MRNCRWQIFIWILILNLLIKNMTYADDTGLVICFINVGQGDAALLQCDGEAMMIDTGPTSAWDHIQSILDQYHISTLCYVVAMHPHADHIGNISKIATFYQINTVILPPIEHAAKTYEHMMESLREAKTQFIYPNVGDTYNLGEAMITVYAPHPVAYSNINDWSIVLMIQYREQKVLFCGDAEYASEMDMLSADGAYPLSADVIKIGRHGSDTSTNPAFIHAVSPCIAIVSCGEKGEYPSTDVAMTLFDEGITDIYTTNICGDIILKLTPAGIVSTMPDAKLPAFARAGIIPLL